MSPEERENLWHRAKLLLEALPAWEQMAIGERVKLIVAVANWLAGAKEPPVGS